MNLSEIDFRINTAQYETLVEHFILSADSFNPPLSTYINVDLYAKKILENAITFEAWSGEKLIGLVATYFNNFHTKIGFVTNLSLLKEYQGIGIASLLMINVINYGGDNGFVRVDLEVKKINTKAIKFYKKKGFIEAGQNKDCLLMTYDINNTKKF